MAKKYRGFTIVELIIAITLLIIIVGISVTQYTEYLSGVRDTNRISQLNDISKVMSIYRINKRLPDPEKGISIISTDGVIGIQGFAGQTVLNKLNFKDGGIDPLDKSYFIYYLSENKKYFQLMGFLENKSDTSINFLTKTYAVDEYKNRFPIVTGDKLGIIIDKNNNPIQNTVSTQLNLTTATGTYTSYLTTTQYITGDNNVVKKVNVLERTGGNGCNSSGTTDIVCRSTLVSNSSSNINISGNFGVNAAGATLINVCGNGTLTVGPGGYFSSAANQGDNCSNMILSKTGFHCSISQNGPSIINGNISNIAGNCIMNNCDFGSGSGFLDCVLY